MENRLDTNKITFTTMARQLEDYDLLPEPNETFRVTFDLYTPRPHFIIRKKPKIFIPPNINVIKDERIMCDLINAAKSVLLGLKIPNATLSIHQGSWKSSPKFHAHLCVDTVTYLKIFNDTVEKGIPVTDLEMQMENFKTREWLGGLYETNVQAYKESVRGYPYKNYFHEEVTAIRAASSGPSHVPESAEEVSAPNESSFNAASCGPSHVPESLRKIYHTKHPMIGFVGKKSYSVDELKKVLLTMEEFAGEKGMTNYDPKNGDDGCHLCLYLGSDWHYTDEDREEVLGYIVTSGPRFYQLCPEDLREQWFEAFQLSFFKCLT